MTSAVQPPIQLQFRGGDAGNWRVRRQLTIAGESLPEVGHLDTAGTASPARWILTGFTSNLRYTAATERQVLAGIQAPLGRPEARLAALLPIRKSPRWWALAQDERLAIYRRSQHYAIGLDYLPAIARRLFHSRDLGEPFDFLTWFEFAAADETAFDHMLDRLRASEEWQYVDREIDYRLAAAA